MRLVDGVLLVVGVVDGLLTGDVVLAGLFAGLVAGLVLPPPMVPPPVAGSCWAVATLAQASRHRKAEVETR